MNTMNTGMAALEVRLANHAARAGRVLRRVEQYVVEVLRKTLRRTPLALFFILMWSLTHANTVQFVGDSIRSFAVGGDAEAAASVAVSVEIARALWFSVLAAMCATQLEFMFRPWEVGLPAVSADVPTKGRLNGEAAQ